MKRLECFVASAFDHDDVDSIYDRVIRPLLRELQCRPLRLDRVEHNDDIDDKIFALLDACDFCIADLTYARPSVYYEAGYAVGRGRPVIYIARNDHLHPRENDPAGNLRVHFDLQMKNIIAWTGPNEAFRKRLCSRLKLVTRPLLQLRDKTTARELETQRFAAKSVRDRQLAITRASRDVLYAMRFKDEDSDVDSNQATFASLSRVRKATLQQVFVTVVPSITQKQLKFLRTLVSLKSDNSQNATEFLIIVASIQAVRDAVFQGAFPSFTPLSAKIVSAQEMSRFGKRANTYTVAIIDKVKSVSEYIERLKGICKSVNVD